MAFDNPKLVADAVGASDPEVLAKSAYINWIFQHLRMNYFLGLYSRDKVRAQVESMFEAEFPRYWWVMARKGYMADAFSKREREFLAIVEEVFEQATLPQEASDDSATNSTSA